MLRWGRQGRKEFSVSCAVCEMFLDTQAEMEKVVECLNVQFQSSTQNAAQRRGEAPVKEGILEHTVYYRLAGVSERGKEQEEK